MAPWPPAFTDPGDALAKVTYQDTACENSAAAQRPVDTSDAFSTKTVRPAPSARLDSRSNTSDSAHANAHGEWRGPAQFQLTLGGVRDGAAQLVTPTVIELKENGEVVGVIPAAGCTMSGLATQFVAEYMASVDVSLKGCRDERFNIRFSGHLTADDSQALGSQSTSLLHVLDEFLDRTGEVRTEAIEDVGPSAVTAVIQDLGQRHAIDAGRVCDLLHSDASRLRELFLLHLLGKFESNH